jgi:protocatechuate 4,5-dioxygenase beta chain
MPRRLAGEERAAAGERGAASLADGATLLPARPGSEESGFFIPADLRVVVLGTGGMSHQLQGKRFGFMNEKFDQWFLDELEKNPENLASLSHHKIMEEAGAEAVELIMWLTMRGALSPKAKRVHRHYYAPMTTGMGLITFED